MTLAAERPAGTAQRSVAPALDADRLTGSYAHPQPDSTSGKSTSGKSTNWKALSLVAVFMGLLTIIALTYSALRDRERALQTDVRRAQSVVAFAETEVLQLSRALSQFAALSHFAIQSGTTESDARIASAREAVDVWFDVVWGRIDVLQHSRESDLLALFPGYRDSVAIYIEALTKAEATFRDAAASPQQATAAQAAAEQLSPMIDGLHQLLVEMVTDARTRLEAQAALMSQSFFILLGVVALAVLLVLGLVTMLLLEIRTTYQHQGQLERTIAILSQREIELEEARRRAEVASQAKTNFLATMSHELRTPLNAVIGFSDAILQRVLGPIHPPRYEDYAQDIRNSAHHLLDMVNDLLSLGRIEAGQMRLDDAEVDLIEILTFATSILQQNAEKAGLDLSIEPGPSQCLVYADERALRQVVINLLSNALKFTGRGGWIKVRCRVDNDGTVYMAVADNGIGIAPEHQRRIFEPFEQVETPLNREREGAGLGLSLAYRLMELHQGGIRVTSQLGLGSMFELWLPSSRLISVDLDRAAQTAQARIV